MYVVLRRVVIKADAEIQRKTAIYAPCVLRVPFYIREAEVALRTSVRLGVSVVIAEQSVGIGVIGVEGVISIAVELNGAACGRTGVLDLARILHVEPKFDR